MLRSNISMLNPATAALKSPELVGALSEIQAQWIFDDFVEELAEDADPRAVVRFIMD